MAEHEDNKYLILNEKLIEIVDSDIRQFYELQDCEEMGTEGRKFVKEVFA